MSISENIAAVRERMAEAAERAGRDPDGILLVAVTKTHGPDAINEAIDAGVTDIGENKVQEIVAKYDSVKPVRWHMIGHLQTNKVKYIADKVSLIHSVDSFHLAAEIDKRCAKIGRTMDILIQINPAGEAQKSGIPPEEAEPLIREILEKLPNIRVKGLMFVAPEADDPENVRKWFREVKALYDACAEIEHPRLDFEWLSMGMSHDFPVAIGEGSNLIRVGTALFGARDYSNVKKEN